MLPISTSRYIRDTVFPAAKRKMADLLSDCGHLTFTPHTLARWLTSALMIFSVVASVPYQAFSQAVYGSIFGTITDPSGAAVPKVRIVVTSRERGFDVETATNPTGNYEAAHLLPGRYTVRAKASGFRTSEITDVPVHIDQASRVDVRLQVGGMKESVTVSAHAVPLLKTERADVAITFNERYISDLPLLNRNFTSLELLTPGTSPFQSWQHASSENPQGGLQIDVNGQAWAMTAFQLDGVDNRDPILGIIVINPTLDSISEAKITTQNYDAEFGQALAGVVTAQTKSGTNNLHGGAFEFRRTSWHQARDPFTQPAGQPLPPTKWYQFGASLGGPIFRNKLFFFGDYQGTRRASGFSKLVSVPTALVRSTCLSPASPICDLSEYPEAIFDPDSANTIQFPGNKIPRDRISSQAVALLSLLPAPNVPETGIGLNFIASGQEGFDDDDFNIRIDHALSQKFRYFARYSFADFRLHAVGVFGPVAGGVGLSTDGFPGQSLTRNQGIAAGVSYTVNPRMLADFRFGFLRYHVNVLPNGIGTTPAKDAGIPNENLGDFLTSYIPYIGVPGQNIDDYTFGTICNCPLLEHEQQFQWVSNWTKAQGNHTFKWGADFRYAQNLRIPSYPPRPGAMTFGIERTQGGVAGSGLGLATLLLGDVTRFERTVSIAVNAGERQKRWFFYGQDTWRIMPKLTMNYGLRWEIIFPQLVTGKGKGGWLDLNTGLISVGGYDHINLQGNVRNTLTNFAPRLGVAYAPNSRTVVRAGYGRSFDIGTFGTVFGHTVTQNLPVLAVQQVLPPNNTDAVFSLKDGPPAPNFVTVPASGKFPLPDQVFASALPDHIRLPTADSWNLSVQRAIKPTFSLEAAYVGNKGTHVFVSDQPTYNANQPTIVGFGILTRDERKPFFRKFGWTQDIRFHGPNASSNYNSLQVKAEKRFTRSYQVFAHYTWSRAMDYSGDYFDIDPRLGYGPSDYNRRHVFVLANVIDLPFGRKRPYLAGLPRWADEILGGWTLASSTIVRSGLPFTPSYSSCGEDIDTEPCRPNRVGEVHTIGSHLHWYTTTNGMPLQPHGTPGDTIGPWQRPAPGTFGNAGRNSLIAPGFWQSDASVEKSFRFKERAAIQFRADIFNLFNTVNLAYPDACVDCLGEGSVFVTVGQQRALQFGLRLWF